jgi:hypothetical protein
LLAVARDSLQQQGHDIALAASLQPRTTQHYEYALQLLSLGVLLDAQERLPALVEKVLCFDTDRVLDYLTAPALSQEYDRNSFRLAAQAEHQLNPAAHGRGRQRRLQEPVSTIQTRLKCGLQTHQGVAATRWISAWFNQCAASGWG